MNKKLLSSLIFLAFLVIFVIPFNSNLPKLADAKIASTITNTPIPQTQSAVSNTVSNPIPGPAQPTALFTGTIFLAGGTSLFSFASTNNVISSSDGISWNQVASSSPWSARYLHTLTALGNIMFVMGGVNHFNPSGYIEYNDIYISSDGNNWLQWLTNAPWSARFAHTAVSHNGRIFIMGGGTIPGTNGIVYFNDVWSSNDGQNWLPNTSNAPWSARAGHSSVVFNGKIYVIGGQTGSAFFSYFNDVWSSVDGTNWTLETANAQWSPRVGHSAIVFNGKIYVMGGQTSAGVINDVWSSSDGINWIRETTNAPWIARKYHVSLDFDGFMWVIGGVNYQQTNPVFTDAWKSADGKVWTQQTSNIPNLNGVGFAGVVMP